MWFLSGSLATRDSEIIRFVGRFVDALLTKQAAYQPMAIPNKTRFQLWIWMNFSLFKFFNFEFH